MKSSIIFSLIFLIYSCKENKIEVLPNPNYLQISDSFKIKLDANTFGNSDNMQLQDSILMINSSANNSLSFINIWSNKSITRHYDSAQIKIKLNLDGAWFASIDSVYILSSNKKKIFLFDSNNNCINIYPIKTNSSKYNKTIPPNIDISTIQIPYINNKAIYASGFIIGEDFNTNDSNRLVVSEIKENECNYFVQYPEDYSGKNWGGIYYRMVYNCVVDDSLMYLSFPASDYIAQFNLSSKKVKYQRIYPTINNLILPYKESWFSNNEKAGIAKHYYGQYSFKGIIYDKYRKIFYRFLLLPTAKEYLKSGRFGIQKKYILAYDRDLNYLGYTEIKESISSSTYFITQKGLIIRDEKYLHDEDYLHFYLFTINNGGK